MNRRRIHAPLRYTIEPTPDRGSGYTSGYVIYDTVEKRTIGAPAYPGYWLTEAEALTVVHQLEHRNDPVE